MLIFFRPITDPYLNIAAEEFFIKHSTEDICMIWLSEKSVIIGKHQNAFAEINYPYIRAHKIPVIRRISGGGAVYHDMGNINFTFIKKNDPANPVDFKQFTTIIADFIQSIGIGVTTNKRNSLFAGSLKFSGHAEHIFHSKVLHHGTLLFNTDLAALQESLQPRKEFQSKAMASVRSEVGNLSPLLPEITGIKQFIKQIIEWLINHYPGSSSYNLSAPELDSILDLAEKKYKTWQWNFGYSPKYSFPVHFLVQNEMHSIHITVENGRFTHIDLPISIKNQKLNTLLMNLSGILHKDDDIDIFIQKNHSELELVGINTVSFKEAFFT